MRIFRMPSASPLAAHTAATRRWLSIVGIGEDGVEGLTPVARGLIADAEIVFGGKRHLELAGALIRGAVRPWPSPFDQAVGEVVEQRGRPVCVLASGDPFFYGVGSLLARHIDPEEMLVVPGPSSFSLAAARLGLAAAGDDLAFAAWPAARADPAASASRRAHSGADARWRGAARPWPRCSPKVDLANRQLTVLEALGGPSRAHSHHSRRRFFARRCRRAQCRGA